MTKHDAPQQIKTNDKKCLHMHLPKQ